MAADIERTFLLKKRMACWPRFWRGDSRGRHCCVRDKESLRTRVGEIGPQIYCVPDACPPQLAQDCSRPRHPKADIEAQEAFKNFTTLTREEVAKIATGNSSIRIMFQDEARFGRINIPRLCWAPMGVRPVVGSQVVREYTYAYAAVSPVDGVMDSLILPEVNTAAFELFLEEVATRHADEFVLMFMDGAGWHTTKN